MDTSKRGSRSVRVKKAKKDKGNKTNATVTENSQRKVRKKSTSSTNNTETSRRGKKEGKERGIPGYLKKMTDEQKAAYSKFVKEMLTLGVAGLLKEYMEHCKPYVADPFKREVFDQHVKLNRYKDVVCNDITRVIINDGKGGDYIHANFVQGDPLYNTFICTQGPMPATVIDFWRMIVNEKCQHIIMLCEVQEQGKTKCEQYWPTEIGGKGQYGDVTVTNQTVACKDAHVTHSTLEVEVGGSKFVVKHHHWKTWPDKTIPKSTRAVLRLLETVRITSRPVVVHCSAGIGRTGTLVAVEMCLQQLLSTCTLNLLEMCKRLRDQRMHSVQVDVQYVYIAQAVMEYGKAMKYWEEQQLEEDFKVFNTQVEQMVKERDDPAKAGAAGDAHQS